MAKKKRKTLPKDFAALLEVGDLAALRAVFDSCEVDARGGYSKQTALAFDNCPDELTRWLVANGADVSATDESGDTPLHARARSWRCQIAILLELGADVHATTGSGTPLHEAASAARVKTVELLLAGGADIDRANETGATPLELMLELGSNASLVEMVSIARMLLAAGATRTPRMKAAVTDIGKRYEFHRSNIASEIAAATSAALEELYVMFDVPPVPRRERHDGRSPIVPKAKTWQAQHAELWGFLVPSSGSAETVQGEVIRLAGKIARELEGNGAVNWDASWVALARAFGELVQRGNSLTGVPLHEAKQIVTSLAERAECDVNRMAQLAVAWVLANPTPMPLGPVDYTF